jgi:probable rRNA maturation factor
MLEVEVLGAVPSPAGREVPTLTELRRLCVLAAASAGVHEGHVAIEFVDTARITELNARYRQRPAPTDVLSFPVDEAMPIEASETLAAPGGEGGEGGEGGPGGEGGAGGVGAAPGVGASFRRPAASRELGDVVICAEHTSDLREAVVHGVLHLLGMDHERDGGEMMALQRELLAGEGR